MAQDDYDNVPIYSGQPPARNDTGYFQPPVPAAEGAIAVDQARAVAEVQAALVIAASRPRNELLARDRLMQACQRKGLAEGAVYQYGRGGSDISGPSIRLAEAAARAWGNMTYGFREKSRREGISDCEAFAWDLETNTKAVREFAVRHKRDKGGSSQNVKTERDIYEVIANYAQRRVRAAILEIIPGDIIEDALAECEKTQKAHVGDIKEAASKLLKAFEGFNVSRAMIEKRLGRKLDAVQPAQIIGLRRIWTSLHEGMSEARDWFEVDTQTTTNPAGAAPPAPAVAPTPEPAKKPSKAKEHAAQDTLTPQDPAPEAPTSSGMYTVVCPQREGMENPSVDEEHCETCKSRKGCPAWAQGE
jgi:hypothetical protein